MKTLRESVICHLELNTTTFSEHKTATCHVRNTTQWSDGIWLNAKQCYSSYPKLNCFNFLYTTVVWFCSTFKLEKVLKVKKKKKKTRLKSWTHHSASIGVGSLLCMCKAKAMLQF